jgi:hypothetical protein
MFFSNLSYIEKQDDLGDKNGPINNVSLPYKPKFGKIKKTNICLYIDVLYSLIIFVKTSPDIFFTQQQKLCMRSKRSPMII